MRHNEHFQRVVFIVTALRNVFFFHYYLSMACFCDRPFGPHKVERHITPCYIKCIVLYHCSLCVFTFQPNVIKSLHIDSHSSAVWEFRSVNWNLYLRKEEMCTVLENTAVTKLKGNNPELRVELVTLELCDTTALKKRVYKNERCISCVNICPYVNYFWKFLVCDMECRKWLNILWLPMITFHYQLTERCRTSSNDRLCSIILKYHTSYPLIAYQRVQLNSSLTPRLCGHLSHCSHTKPAASFFN